MTIHQRASFDVEAAGLNATSKTNPAVAKMLAAWENKNAKRAMQGSGLALMAMSLTACGGSSSTTTAATTTTTTTTAAVSSNFTSEIDSLAGGAGADTFTGDTNTVSEADQVAGGAGSDTVKIYGDTALPTMTGVETLYQKSLARDLDVSAVTGLTSVELDTFSLAAARDVKLTADASFALSNVTGTANAITLSNNVATAQTISVSKSGDATNAIDLDLDGDAVATLNVSSLATGTTGASFINVANTGAVLATVNVTGTGDLTIENIANATAISITSTGKTTLDTAVAKVVVTGVAGAETITLDHATGTAREFSVSTGAGNDVISLNAMVAAADFTDSKVTISGGAGDDTLAMKSAAGAALSALTAVNFTKKGIVNDFETIRILDQAATTDALGLARVGSNVKTVDYAAGLGAAQTLTGLASGGTVVLGAAASATGDTLTTTVLNSATAGAITDVLNITLDGLHAGATLVYGVVNAANVETININSTSTKATALVAADVNDFDAIVANASTVNISGNVFLDLGNDALTGVQIVNASTNTAGVDIVVDTAAAVAITGTAKADRLEGDAGADNIKGGGGIDNIVGAAGNDIIDGGAGNDIITAGAGSDTVTLGAGSDDLVLATVAATGTTFNQTVDIIKDFVAGTDDIDVNTVMVSMDGNNAVASAYLDVSAGAATTTITGNTTTGIFEFSANADVLGEGVSGTFDASTATGAQLEAAVIEQLTTDVAVAQTAGVDTTHMLFVMYDEAGNAVVVNYTDATTGNDVLHAGDFYEFNVLEDVAQGTLTTADFI